MKRGYSVVCVCADVGPTNPDLGPRTSDLSVQVRQTVTVVMWSCGHVMVLFNRAQRVFSFVARRLELGRSDTGVVKNGRPQNKRVGLN